MAADLAPDERMTMIHPPLVLIGDLVDCHVGRDDRQQLSEPPFEVSLRGKGPPSAEMGSRQVC